MSDSPAAVPRSGGTRWIEASLVFVLAILVFTTLGHEADLLHDEALYLYGGWQMLRGTPPYVSIFHHVGPLTEMLCGLGAWIGSFFGLDVIGGARAFFLVLSAAAVVAVHALARELFRSSGLALLAAAVFIAFGRFAYHAVGGPLPKTLVVLFGVLSLLFCARRRWFASACSGALAGLAWQPAAMFALITLFVARFHGADRRRGRRAAASAALGLALPLAALSLYFLIEGAFFELLDGAVFFNFLFLESPSPIRRHLYDIAEAVYMGFPGLGHPIALGLTAIPLVFLWRRRAAGGALRALVRDRFSAFLLAFLPPLVWSVLDFQQYPDFFIMLPWAAIGFAWLLFEGLRAVAGLLDTRAGTPNRLALLAGIVILLGARYVYAYHRPQGRLPERRAQVQAIAERAGPGARIVAVGAPRVLLLLGLEGPTSYGFLMRGIDRHIEARFPGGFAGWLAALDAARPDLLVVHPEIRLRLQPRFAQLFEEWLAGYRRVEGSEYFELYAP